jgi:hypothetical protein
MQLLNLEINPKERDHRCQVQDLNSQLHLKCWQLLFSMSPCIYNKIYTSKYVCKNALGEGHIHTLFISIFNFNYTFVLIFF